MAAPVVMHPLEPLCEGWQRGLAIVAHPDDLEFGAAAAIARWTGQGKQIVYCLVTSGEAGIDTMAPAQARQVRAAAAVVGVAVVEFLSQPDGGVEYGVPLRRALARVVRRHRPEIVITTNCRDTWDGAVVLNQADHRATGWAVLDAVSDAGNRWVFPELLAEGLASWSGVTQVWAAGAPDARHGVDITATFAQGVASLRAHEQHCSPSSLAHADPVYYTKAQDFWKQGACGTPHAVKRGAVSGGQPGRNESLSIVEVRARRASWRFWRTPMMLKSSLVGPSTSTDSGATASRSVVSRIRPIPCVDRRGLRVPSALGLTLRAWASPIWAWHAIPRRTSSASRPSSWRALQTWC